MEKLHRKKHSVFFCLLLLFMQASSQITTPVIKANFGTDADLRCNFFNGLVQSGNDDWFRLPGSTGTGQFMIDTTGAAALLAGYIANPALRKLPFYREMRYPPYTKLNNRILVDAIFVRDYHGNDSTVFAMGSNKNGMSPVDWSCPVSQSIPDKNEILDIMLHVRRAGPTLTDSLWMFGGISIENTTGNRYFDFEMYQTDIYYDRPTRKFYNYGPDAGHTSWVFDPATGNMLKPGDIILTAEYSSSSLTMIEPRIWVNINTLSITPSGFDWTGTFDGASAGAQFGYAGIKPKTAGAFFTGLQSNANTWAGPFSVVLGDNSVQTDYTARQYMEFSVNLTKLGLSHAPIFGGDDCRMPFRRIIVKTRASTSFTSELKDFVAPFDFFLAPRAVLETQTPFICDTGSIATINVSNPIPTSVYLWSTPNGHIVGPTTGPSIIVDTPGVYIVTQYLQAGCSLYAADTITIGSFGNCSLLASNLTKFSSGMNNRQVLLHWEIKNNEMTRYFDLERSTDGVHFDYLKRVFADSLITGAMAYNTTDDPGLIQTDALYYRLKVFGINHHMLTSRIIKQNIRQNEAGRLLVYPNPASAGISLQFQQQATGKACISLVDLSGKVVHRISALVHEGENVLRIEIPGSLAAGLYRVMVQVQDKTMQANLVVRK